MVSDHREALDSFWDPAPNHLPHPNHYLCHFALGSSALDTGQGQLARATSKAGQTTRQIKCALSTVEASLSPNLPQSLRYCPEHFVSSSFKCHHPVQSSTCAPRPSLSCLPVPCPHSSEPPQVACRSRHSPFPVGGHPESFHPLSSEDKMEAHRGLWLPPNHSASQSQGTNDTSTLTGAPQVILSSFAPHTTPAQPPGGLSLRSSHLPAASNVPGSTIQGSTRLWLLKYKSIQME